MKRSDVNPSAVEETIKAMPDEFTTDELTDREIMLKGHGRKLGDGGNYRSIIGNHLSDHAAGLGIRCVNPNEGSPARWRKVGW